MTKRSIYWSKCKTQKLGNNVHKTEIQSRHRKKEDSLYTGNYLQTKGRREQSTGADSERVFGWLQRSLLDVYHGYMSSESRVAEWRVVSPEVQNAGLLRG